MFSRREQCTYYRSGRRMTLDGVVLEDAELISLLDDRQEHHVEVVLP
jgi:hypothetical protein